MKLISYEMEALQPSGKKGGPGPGLYFWTKIIERQNRKLARSLLVTWQSIENTLLLMDELDISV